MRILVYIFMGIILIIYCSLIVEASGLERASLSQERVEGEPTETILRLNGDSDWNWLQLELMGKFLIVPVEDEYSSCNVKLIFPGIGNNLIFKEGYDWDDKYKVYNTKLSYSFAPFKPIELEIGYEKELRNPELNTGYPYRFNSQFIDFTWQQKLWEYSFNLTRNDKDYYQDSQYTSLKYQLEETLTWYPQSNLRFQLGYTENSGDYITSGYKDFWKEEWIFDSEIQDRGHWQYGLEYHKLFWERGYQPYRGSQRVLLKIGNKINSNFKVTFGVSFRDLNYYSETQDYSEPGVYYKVESDLKSRLESKAGMEFQFENTKYEWEAGPFWGHTHYDSPLVKDFNRVGIYGSLTRKYRYFEFSVKMAPRGDLSTQDAYYQMEISYKPAGIK